MELNNRKLTVLSLISREYLETGEPIGSKLIVSRLGSTVSSATIRNDMAELERAGLLFQPHTSAGRIPTTAGLRLYIDRFMQKKSLSKTQRNFIDSLLSNVHSIESAITAASDVLADYSKCASFLTFPSGADISLKQIEFIKTSNKELVFVLITETNVVKSTFVRLNGELTDDALNVLSTVCKKRLNGIPLKNITPPFIQGMAAELSDYFFVLSPFFQLLYKETQKLSSPSVYIKGQDNLIKNGSSDIDIARALDTLHSDYFLNLLSPDGNIKIIIPDMSDELQNVALIYTGYHFSDNLSGAVGVLGPYRLDYGSIIPMIEYFSTSLEKMIKQNDSK